MKIFIKCDLIYIDKGIEPKESGEVFLRVTDISAITPDMSNRSIEYPSKSLATITMANGYNYLVKTNRELQELLNKEDDEV